jgi:eukaryotic-like serine/threonine-protein kinase
MTRRSLLIPGGALQGPLFASLLERIATEPRELPRGQVIGPYRLLEPLGRGGMAVVYLAERADGEFDQKVALKIISPGRESPTARELMRRERQILASLSHRHIAGLLDGGTTEDGLIWFAMEPVRGLRIDAFCRERATAIQQRLRLVLQVCDAVQFAHARLLVHRDLKPSNILVTDDGEAKLLDFGIAMAVHDGHVPALTPAFASPEQRRGDAVTTASDIWQLGNLLRILIDEQLAAHPRRFVDHRAIIERATHDEPASRYASAGELAADVRRAIEHRPVAARAGTAWYRMRRFVGRHRWSSAAIAFALVGFVALATGFALRLAHERDAVVREAERANAATEFMVGLFRGADPSVHRGRPIDARELLARGVDRLRSDLVAQPALRARLLSLIGRVELAIGEPARARPLFEESLELLRGPVGTPTARAEALQGLGETLLWLANPTAALGPLRDSLALIGDDGSAALRRRRAVLDLLAMAQLGSGQIPAALASAREAVAIAEAEHGARSVEAGLSRKNLGIVMNATATPAERAIELEQSWAILSATRGEDHPDTVSVKKLYAHALLDAGRLAEAKPLLEQTIEAQRKLFHGTGATYAAALRSLGRLHAEQNDHRRAIELYHQAEAAAVDAIGKENADAISWTAMGLGSSHDVLGQHDVALGHFERALASRRRMLPPDHLLIAQSLDACSRQLVRLSRGAEAEVLSRESLAIRTRRLAPDDPDLSRSLLPLGAARWINGGRAEARELWDRALQLLGREGRDGQRVREARSYIATITGQGR